MEVETTDSSSRDLAAPLLAWYAANARDLPWRSPPGTGVAPDPFRVWLAEIMLQQTTVRAVIPRYRAFLARWPTVAALAAAREEEVMAAWAGLGYYARARALLAAAREVAARGGFPATEATLARLPGIGPYTAAAIAAIAFGERTAAVDGNVARVAARWFGLPHPPPRLQDVSRERLMPHVPMHAPGDFAQALMDLGSLVCVPRTPRCDLCPVARGCSARAAGLERALPVRPPRRPRPRRSGVAWWIEAGGGVALVQRPPRGLLAGMFALPGSDWSEASHEVPLPFPGPWRHAAEVVRHGFTHFELALRVAAIRLPERPSLPFAVTWVPPDRIAGLPTVFARAAEVGRRLLEEG
ncbi:A/G-specific adenine glycosylase [Thermaurantiacus sp.]